LFKRNPARRRINQKKNCLLEEQGGNGDYNRLGTIPETNFQPLVLEPIPKILSNGWNPPSTSTSTSSPHIPDYPFKVSRTKNKPNGAIGFLPVYSEFRKDGARATTRIKKVSGNRELFLNELRAALQIPLRDTIRIRTGGTIEIKGNRVHEIKTWLAGLGF